MDVRVKSTDKKNVLSKSDLPVCDFSANPYVGCPHACKYCYASFMKRFTGHAEPWGSFLDVKYWPSIKNPEKYAGKGIFIGSVTDPYNPFEEQFGRTRALLEQLAGSGAKISIATKSDLVLRDLDLIKSFPDARVSWSINTLNADFQSGMDEAASIERRLAAMKIFHDAGVRTTCFVSPIFPGITDVPAIVQRVKEQCNLIWLENLNLRGGYKAEILAYIHSKRPDLMQLYHRIYSQNDRSYWEAMNTDIQAFAEEEGLPYLRDDDTLHQPFDAPPTIVNYFYHEEIKRSVKEKRPCLNSPK